MGYRYAYGRVQARNQDTCIGRRRDRRREVCAGVRRTSRSTREILTYLVVAEELLDVFAYVDHLAGSIHHD